MEETLYELAKQAAKAHITPGNSLSVWELTSRLPDCKDVEAAAKEVVLSRFNDVVPFDSFLQTQKWQLEELLADKRLASPDEEFVYEAVMRWLGAQRPMPMFADVAELMALIRYPLMRPSFVQESVRANALFTNDCAREVLLNSYVTAGSLSARRDINEQENGCYSSAYTFNNVSDVKSGEQVSSPSFMFGKSRWCDAPDPALCPVLCPEHIQCPSAVNLLPAPRRYIKLRLDAQETALGLYLCYDGGVRPWRDKKTKIDFGFGIQTQTRKESLSGRFPSSSLHVGWPDVIPVAEFIAASASNQLVVTAWMTASRYEGGVKRVRLS